MQPAARVQAVIDLLIVLGQGGTPADRVFERWSRQNRYAGSKDRRAIGEMFFSILRNRRRLAAAAGFDGHEDTLDADTFARSLVAFYLKIFEAASLDNISSIFSGLRHAPAVLSENESQALRNYSEDPQESLEVRASVPLWAAQGMAAHLGDDYAASAQFLCERAAIDIRVNSQMINRAEVQDLLRQEDIETEPLAACLTALRVVAGRTISQSSAYKRGLIEVQDLGSQIVCAALAQYARGRVLDYCAGAGGKALALADMAPEIREIEVHDANPSRMRDLWHRAARAGISKIQKAKLDEAGQSFDLVLADVPCSGSGRWRRNPEQKWVLSAEDLARLLVLQAQILEDAGQFVRPGGFIAYVTCSVLEQENRAQINSFCAQNNAFMPETAVHITVSPATFQSDGLYACVLQRRVT